MTIALRKPAGLGGLSPIVWERDDMKVILRRATEADAKHAASLLTELGYPSTEADARTFARAQIENYDHASAERAK